MLCVFPGCWDILQHRCEHGGMDAVGILILFLKVIAFLFFFFFCWLSNAATGSTSAPLRHNGNCDCSRTFLKIFRGNLVLNFISGCWFNRVALYLINYLPSVAKGFCPCSNGANYRAAIKLTMM